LAQTLNNFRQK